jgi:hypothetical protein
MDTESEAEWPRLSAPGWTDTLSTLHMWTQIVGKTRMALSPHVNHWWEVPLYLTSHGLGTSVMYFPGGALELEFDFLEHQLTGRTSTGRRGALPLEPQSVAAFYRSYQRLLEALGVSAHIWTHPVEVPVSVPFERDTLHTAYDGRWATRLWRALARADRVLKQFRAAYLGKTSPVHFFWGSFDLAVTRFSGRSAPPHPGGAYNCPDWVMREAYSHEVSSAGFWPGSRELPSPLFYSYAYPEPADYRAAAIAPAAAHYDTALKEFVLPYDAVLRASDPDRDLLAFFQSTYEAAANAAAWNRSALERAGASNPTH